MSPREILISGSVIVGSVGLLGGAGADETTLNDGMSAATVIQPIHAFAGAESPLLRPGQKFEYDVLVYGGTAGGVMAAVAAARTGASVALLEPGRHLGGMVSGGLGATDVGESRTVGGLAREFFEQAGWGFEPHTAEAVINEMVDDAGVDLFLKHRLVEGSTSVRKDGSRIESVVTENGSVFAANVFIDATYEGDLMAWAGVSYAIGRESADQYGESLAGVVPDNGGNSSRPESHRSTSMACCCPES